MTDNTRDYLMWKNGKGRYSEGGKHYGSKAPQEGGVLAPEYRASTASRPQALYRSHNVAPEGMAQEYTPIQMVTDPFDGSAKAKAGALEVEPITQDAEAQNVYTPISRFIEGEPAGSVQ